MFNQATLKIELEFGKIDTKHMMVQSLHRNITMHCAPDHTNRAILCVDVELPDEIVLEFFGKDPDHDTKLDENGNITEDLFVKIVGISLAGFDVPKIFLPRLIHLQTTDNRLIQSNYIGFDGKVTLTLPKHSIFEQVISWKS